MEGAKVIVTGGANGIGRSITEACLAQGAIAAVIDMDRSGLAAMKRKFGDRFWGCCGDVGSQEDLEGFARDVIARFGTVDYLINNACLSRGGILTPCSYEDFSYVLQVGVTAPYYLSMKFLPCFAQGGAIVNISSTRSFQSQPNTESYTAAKGAIAALTHGLSVSLAGRVRVNAISPGWIDTKPGGEPLSPADLTQHPVKRVGEPEDIAHMALFLCSDKAGFITGQNFVIDGGMTRQMVYHGDEGWRLNPEGR